MKCDSIGCDEEVVSSFGNGLANFCEFHADNWRLMIYCKRKGISICRYRKANKECVKFVENGVFS